MTRPLRFLATASLLGLAFVLVPAIATFARQAPAGRPDVEAPAKRPADPLDGPPLLSAKAWAIADGRTGEVLWGDRQAEPLPMASTAKMMTALVMARIIDRNRETPE